MLKSIKYLFVVIEIKRLSKLFYINVCNFKIMMYLCTAFNEDILFVSLLIADSNYNNRK